MKKRTKHSLISTGAAVCMAATLSTNAQTVEEVVSLDIDNPRAFMSAMEEMVESGALDGYDVRLWSNRFDGSNPATHTIVVHFDGYQAQQSLTEKREQHSGWTEFLQAVDDLSSATSYAMAVELYRTGELRDDHTSGVAFLMSVEDPAAYAPALRKLADAQGHPGSMRLMQLRYGGMGSTHAVLLSAPDSVAMNEYLDELLASDDYAEFAETVSDVRTIRTVNNYALARHWRN